MYNKREFKKNLCYIVNFMQALMSIQYYVEPENIYWPKLSRMKMMAFFILDITSTTKSVYAPTNHLLSPHPPNHPPSVSALYPNLFKIWPKMQKKWAWPGKIHCYHISILKYNLIPVHCIPIKSCPSGNDSHWKAVKTPA